MTTKLRKTAAAAAALAVSAGLAACGDSVPGNSVARVGDESIKKATFDHWMNIAAISTSGAAGTTAAKPVVPDPPNFDKCVANKTKTATKPAKGQPKPTPAQYKTQCKQEYESLRDQVMQFLLSAQWILGEAADRDVKVTDAEVKKQWDQTKQQSFPNASDFTKFLKSSGYVEEDLMYRVKLDAVSNKLREKVVKDAAKVSAADIKSYYEKNPQRFSQPERRDLRIVLTKTKERADQARAAIAGGQSFAAVAKRYSIDQASKSQGGVLLAVSKGQQEKALDEAIFSAKKGQLTGPIKTQFGFYVFQVQKITPGSKQSLKQSEATIKSLLTSERQQKSLDGFVKDFRETWKDRTNCKDGFVTQDCKNAPKTSSTATTVAPSQVPQQQAPPANGGS
ncbi:peptidyl-prolyl cis-trans isomerase [Conexibacter sp. SYSU D00693]|uniref:peptidyl-prolyl cis-trans isomerase n=1 Tax=Conexibacter sp. SYSU D00693 TaxID=2812560 RepID=UPI00196B8B95|nr:peptidyl-prolyl cis-trans isomerase [Conexibacter sp. SYSU D00693]